MPDEETFLEKELKKEKKEVRKARKLIKKDPKYAILKYTTSKVLDFDQIYNVYEWHDGYAKQVIQISKLRKNLGLLEKIDKDSKVPYPIKTRAYNFNLLCVSALDIYSRQFDTPEFDKDVERLNEFLDKHIARVGLFGHTFKIVRSKELENSPKGTSYGSLKEKNLAEFNAMGERFARIYSENEKELEDVKMWELADNMPTAKLNLNLVKLQKVAKNPNIPYSKLPVVNKFIRLCIDGLAIYDKEIETRAFEEDVKDLNQYLQSHIRQTKIGYIFTVVSHKELSESQEREIDIRQRNLGHFERMQDRFTKILDKNMVKPDGKNVEEKQPENIYTK